MARYGISNKKAVGYPTAKSVYPSTSSRDRIRGVQNMRYGKNPFLTPERVGGVFGVDLDGGWYDDVEDCESEEDFVRTSQSGDYFRPEYQLSFDLETVDEKEARLVKAIRTYEAAASRMAAYALSWHDLMEDLEENENLAKSFNEFQMLRKLSGGTC